jgi:uncharacterized protein (TIGR03083 family)
MLTKDFYLQRIEEDTVAMAAAAKGADLDTPVPSCPGWSLADLVAHMAKVHHNWNEVVSRRITQPEELASRTDFERPPREQLINRLENGAGLLIETLASRDPDEPTWNWSSTQPQTVAFVPRRMAHETSVHRWDAQSATGTVEPIDSELAADGIDEFLYVHLPEEEGSPPEAGTVHVHRTDGPGEWFITMGPGGVEVREEHAKGDTAVRAPASDLVLMLWRRISPSTLEVLGDRTVLDRFVSWVDLN